MASKQLELPIFHYDDPATGSPLVGGLVYTYAAGTSTAQTTYTDSSLYVANANPVVLDAYGNAKIWFDQPLKVIVRSADGLTTYFTEDNISPTGGTSVVFGNFNAVLNGDFESDTSGSPDNWTLSAYSGGTVAVDTSVASSGAQSLKFTGTGSGGGTARSTLFEVEASRTLSVNFTYKSSNAGTTNTVTIFWFQKDGTTAASTASTVVYTNSSTNPTSMTRYNLTATAPSNATYAYVLLTGVSSGGAQLDQNTHFDNILVYASKFKGALVRRSSDVAAATPLAFNATIYDTSSIFGSSTTFTIPVDVTKVRISWCLYSTGGVTTVSLYKNGALLKLGTGVQNVHGITTAAAVTTGIISVTSGDTFTLIPDTIIGITAITDSWFGIEIIE